MSQDAMHQIDINACSEEEMAAIYKKVGYPFPLGPVIPRPDPSWPPLWKGLVQDGLDRQRAAAEVALRFYLTRFSADRRNPKGELITRMDYAFRNWWTFMYADQRNNSVDGWQITQPLVRTLSRLFSVIEIDPSDFDLPNLKEAAKRSEKKRKNKRSRPEEGDETEDHVVVAHDPFGMATVRTSDMVRPLGNVADLHRHRILTKEELLQEALENLPGKLDEQVEALYKPDEEGRIKKIRQTPLVFSKNDYSRGWKLKKTSALVWSEQTDDVKQHVQTLLDEPAGEWNVFVLLFLKLLHIHLAWIVPPRLGTMLQEAWREATRAIYYRPLLYQLGLCAKSDHPLSTTAAGIHQTLGRVGLLMGTGPGNGSPAAFQGGTLDPRDSGLPDCLHIDSPSGIHECIGEVIAILKWKYGRDCDEDCTTLIATVHEVAALAKEMASIRTDPFALGGLSLEKFAQQGTMTNNSRFLNDWMEISKGVGALLEMLKGEVLTKTQMERNLNRLPLRWIDSGDAFASEIQDFAASSSNKQGSVDLTVRGIERWVVRSQQLHLFATSINLLFDCCGLERFQSNRGVKT